MARNEDRLLLPDAHGLPRVLGWGTGQALEGLSAAVTLQRLEVARGEFGLEVTLDFGSEAEAAEFVRRVAASRDASDYRVRSGGKTVAVRDFDPAYATRYMKLLAGGQAG